MTSGDFLQAGCPTSHGWWGATGHMWLPPCCGDRGVRPYYAKIAVAGIVCVPATSLPEERLRTNLDDGQLDQIWIRASSSGERSQFRYGGRKRAIFGASAGPCCSDFESLRTS